VPSKEALERHRVTPRLIPLPEDRLPKPKKEEGIGVESLKRMQFMTAPFAFLFSEFFQNKPIVFLLSAASSFFGWLGNFHSSGFSKGWYDRNILHFPQVQWKQWLIILTTVTTQRRTVGAAAMTCASNMPSEVWV